MAPQNTVVARTKSAMKSQAYPNNTQIFSHFLDITYLALVCFFDGNRWEEMTM
jgi:hypothetical protein